MIEIGTRGGRAGVAEQEDMDKGSSKVSGGTRIFVARIAQGISDEMFRRCGNSCCYRHGHRHGYRHGYRSFPLPCAGHNGVHTRVTVWHD